MILGFYFKIFIINNLGISYLGTYSLGISFISILMIFVTLGYGNSLIFFLPKYLSNNNYSRLHKYLQKTLKINITIIIITTGFVLSFPSFISNQLLRTSEIEPYLIYFIILFILESFITIFINILIGFQKTHKTIIIKNFICNPFRILSCILLINYNLGFHGFLIAEILSAFLAITLFSKIIYGALKKINIQNIFSKNNLSLNNEEKAYTKNILLKTIFNSITLHLVKILIIFYTDLKSLGTYTILISITSFIAIIHDSVWAIIKPIISQLKEEKKIDAIFEYFQVITRYNFIISLPIIGSIFLSKNFILNYLGINNATVEFVLLLLIMMEVIKCAKGPVFIVLEMMGFHKEIRNIVSIKLLLTLIFFPTLIPQYGLVGIGLAEILSTTFSIIISSIILNNKTSIHIFHSRYLIHFSISIISFIIMIMFKNYNNHDETIFFLGLDILSVFIFLILPNLLFIRKKDLKFIQSYFSSV